MRQKESRIGRYLLTFVKNNNVARYYLCIVQDNLSFATQYRRLRFDEVAQSAKRILRSPFLNGANEGVEKKYGEDDTAVNYFPDDENDDACTDEDIDEWALELPHEYRDVALRLLLRERVLSVCCEPPTSFLIAQSSLRA